MIDAHNHLFGDLPAEKLIEVMDAVGVRVWVNVTGNVTLPLENNTYTIARRDFGPLRRALHEAVSGTLRRADHVGFRPVGRSGAACDDDFADRCIQHLEEDLAKGACGLKVTKELGLFFPRSRTAPCCRVDDERLFPIWRRAGELGVPVLIHVSDPAAFFLPIDAANEHYLTLREFPGLELPRLAFLQERSCSSSGTG